MRRRFDWFLFALVVVATTTRANGKDYALLIEGQPDAICATSRATCETARIAIARGWFFPELSGMRTICVEHPNCFTGRENCIVGYRGPRSEGRCR